MKRFFLLIIQLVFITQLIHGMAHSAITGQVTDQNSEALPFASIQAKNKLNNTSKGSMADDRGYFCFSHLEPGEYQIIVSYLGFRELSLEPITVEPGEEKALSAIRMSPNDYRLSEVTITGRDKISEIKPAQIMYKTSALISQSGGNAGDVLKNMPSVAMGGSPGHNRDIRFRGLGNSYTKVLVNGQETGFKGNNRESILDQIPASSIDRIEIMSVPGVEYQSEGINGIVNIILKENHHYGTHGGIEMLAGNSGGLSGGMNLTHKVGKWAFHSQYDFQQRSLPKTKDKIKTDFKDGIATAIEENIEYEDKIFNNQALRLGADYFLFPKTKLSAVYAYGYQLEKKKK